MKKLISIIAILLIANVMSFKSTACIWEDNGNSYRISMFSPEIKALQGFRAFYYSPYKLNAYFPRQKSDDRYKNCREWQEALGGNCKIEDIFKILYETEAEKVIKDADKFFADNADNSFIKALNGSPEWNLYFIIAKVNEFYNTALMKYWSGESNKDPNTNYQVLLANCKTSLASIKNPKVEERFAFQFIRLYKMNGEYSKVIELYNKYFSGDNKSIIKTWATLFYAEALKAKGKEVTANLLFSKLFETAEEKRIRAYNMFDMSLFNATLELAKNNKERATLWAIKAVRTPGRALEYIKKVVDYNSRNKIIPLLIMREINKLEDWIFTPELTGNQPCMRPSLGKEDYYAIDYDKVKEKNRQTDLAYLKEFKAYLKKISPKLNSKLKDYLLIAQAHLALMERENKEALALFKKVSYNAESPILVQRSVALVLYYIYEGKLNNKKAQQKLTSTLKELEGYAKKERFYYKYLSSLTKVISNKYLENKQIAEASLFANKSIAYEQCYEYTNTNIEDVGLYYFTKISFLNEHAGLNDMDNLLSLIGKKTKTEYQKYMCSNAASRNALLDLKGTIALRQGDINTAYKAFSQMPHDFWKKTYAFADYLDENPFVMPYSKAAKAKKEYKFNKADVLNKVRDYLELAQQYEKTMPSKACFYYTQIGNFFYNSSYYGNSWMMLSYSQTCSPYYKYFIKNKDNKAVRDYENSYYKCEPALHYFNKAAKFANNPEDIATTLFMKHLCKNHQHWWTSVLKENYDAKFDATDLKQLYADYSNTELFKSVKCPVLNLFVGKKEKE